MWATAGLVAIAMMLVAAVAPGLVLGVAPWKFPKLRLAWYVGLVGALALCLFLVSVRVAEWLHPGIPLALPVAATATLTAGVIVASQRGLLPLRRARKLADALARQPSSAATRRELVALAEHAPKNPRFYPAHATLVLTVVGALAEASRWDEAVTLLESLDAERIGPGLRGTRAISLASCLLYTGDRDGARAALAAAPRPIDRQLADAWHATEALLLALSDAPREALARLDAMPAPSDPRFLRSRAIARAHAQAAMGDAVSARETLEQLRDAVGAGALVRVRALNGPASPIATSLLTGDDPPYR